MGGTFASFLARLWQFGTAWMWLKVESKIKREVNGHIVASSMNKTWLGLVLGKEQRAGIIHIY